MEVDTINKYWVTNSIEGPSLMRAVTWSPTDPLSFRFLTRGVRGGPVTPLYDRLLQFFLNEGTRLKYIFTFTLNAIQLWGILWDLRTTRKRQWNHHCLPNVVIASGCFLSDLFFPEVCFLVVIDQKKKLWFVLFFS